jgi:hypothetical protein
LRRARSGAGPTGNWKSVRRIVLLIEDGLSQSIQKESIQRVWLIVTVSVFSEKQIVAKLPEFEAEVNSSYWKLN